MGAGGGILKKVMYKPNHIRKRDSIEVWRTRDAGPSLGESSLP